MGEIIVRGMQLRGHVDRYDPPAGPNYIEVREGYMLLEQLLESEGKLVVPLEVTPLPLIDDGVISGSAAVSCYLFNQCLVLNELRPHFSGDFHVITAAARIEDKQKIDETFGIFKERGLWRYSEYWRDCGPERTVEVSDKLEDIARIAPYIPKLLPPSGGK